jgi:hypothetical protein
MNLTIDINNKTEIRNAITLLESLLPKPAAKVAAKAVKKIDPPNLPNGIPDPPTGYIYAGLGPLKFLYHGAGFHVITIRDGEWDYGITGYAGTLKGKHYAVKKGTKIAKLNGL